ncbi:acyltransferase [Chlorobium phaeovibrioides]|uniref:Acyltransferase n=1 Tax=Chlorobium phaeovibrioides TaxID=1094 RepID=A0A432AUB4_CHLPH|nr:acyltransferase [Chlorobium phaeovibrioides]RTY37774.1 acyltransferase [Chlorobium phaeovibrioides]
MANKRKFLRHIHYFRGFAIINVMIVHIWNGPTGEGAAYTHAADMIRLLQQVFFHDSTIYFIFVSGFLVEYLSATKNPLGYYGKKIANVIVPYLIMSTLWFLWESSKIPQSTEDLPSLAGTYLSMLTYGKAQIQYWYIPFIAVVFLLSPLILRIPDPAFNRITLAASILPLLGTRTGTEISAFQFIYLLPVYLQGIYAARNHDRVIDLAKKHQPLLAFLALACTIALMYLHGNSISFGPTSLSESIHYIHKSSIMFIVLPFLASLEQKSIKALDLFARYSFAIFFTHITVSMYLVWKILPPETIYSLPLISASSYTLIMGSILYLFIKIFATLFCCIAAKKVLGSTSRFLIGA